MYKSGMIMSSTTEQNVRDWDDYEQHSFLVDVPTKHEGSVGTQHQTAQEASRSTGVQPGVGQARLHTHTHAHTGCGSMTI